MADMSRSQMPRGSEMMALCRHETRDTERGQVHYCAQKPSQNLQQIHESAVVSSQHMLSLRQAQLDIPDQSSTWGQGPACLTCECVRPMCVCLAPEGI